MWFLLKFAGLWFLASIVVALLVDQIIRSGREH
jgi:hypothetical protein